MDTRRSIRSQLLHRTLFGTIALAAMLAAGFGVANSAEIVPSVGLSRTVDGDNDVEMSAGLAFRGHLAEILMTELGIGYRSEDLFDDQLKMRMWPITASLYLRPVPAIYAGAGVGWYNVTFDYADEVPIEDETEQEFGVHVGGGFQVPLAPSAAIDLNGRYVFMQEQESELIPDTWDPDFWSTHLGLALKF